MTYNDRTDVWEYWVSLNPSAFSTNGAISLDATVYGEDGGRRTLDTITLYVNATGGLVQPEAWVTTSGNDTTGTLGEESLPYASISGALADIQGTYGTCAGAIVWLGDGEWTLGNGSVTTATEWLTFAGASGTARENVIIHGAGGVTTTDRLRFYDLTLRSDGADDNFLAGWPDPEPTWLWVDTCTVVGGGRWTANSSPVYRDDNWFCTDSYMTNTDITMRFADLVRNVDVEAIGDDCCFLCDVVINLTLHNQDPNENEDDGTPTYDHSDGWQWAGSGMENKIVYGYHGTDMHYQGIFARMAPNGGTHRNSAFVNVLMEMRDPKRPGSSSDPGGQFEAASFYGPLDHIIVWHCTFPNGLFSFYDEPMGVEFEIRNSSFIGNVFEEFMDWDQGGTDPVGYGAPGNAENNEFLHNHYRYSRVDGMEGWGLYSKSPDTDPSGSQSLGDPDIVTTLDAADYGTPNATSPLLDRLTEAVVPIDVFGNVRDSIPDVGAIERV
jgi:hypothetical protein